MRVKDRAKAVGRVLTDKERRAICHRNSAWPEAHVTDCVCLGVPKLHLSCGHISYRRRRVRVGATVLCEQCAERA